MTCLIMAGVHSEDAPAFQLAPDKDQGTWADFLSHNNEYGPGEGIKTVSKKNNKYTQFNIRA